jgi:hypothetical protein
VFGAEFGGGEGDVGTFAVVGRERGVGGGGGEKGVVEMRGGEAGGEDQSTCMDVVGAERGGGLGLDEVAGIRR